MVERRIVFEGDQETETIINDTKEVLLRMFEKEQNENKTVFSIDLPAARAATCRVLIGEVLSSGSTSIQGDPSGNVSEPNSFNHFLLEDADG